MAAERIQERVTQLLTETNAAGGYPSSLVCTHDGLVIASSGDEDAEYTAAVVSLFDDILVRARRDLDFEDVDEVALLDPGRGRTIIRPLPMGANTTVFLVVRVPPKHTWRRNTNILRKQLVEVLEPLVSEAS